MTKKKSRRIQFNFSDELLEVLNKIGEKLDASSQAEVIRRLVKREKYIQDMIEEGYNHKIELQKGDDVIILPPLGAS